MFRSTFSGPPGSGVDGGYGTLDGPQGERAAPDPTRCSTTREGPYVNVSVTAPGATLALALFFLKSNNAAVAARLAIPDTHFLLDYVRPDFLLLHVF